YPLDLQQRQEYHGGAVFWSPRKLREARAREATKRDEAEREQLQRSQDKERKAAASLYKKKQDEAAKAERQKARGEAAMAKKARAEELAAARALKKQQHDAAIAQKSRDRLNNSKRKASHNAANIPAKRRHVVAAASRVEAAPKAPPAPAKMTRTWSIRTPKKFLNS
ncbi:hypothetical protein EJ07DRAFT_121660, partial [Lizonia empirigonia]